MASQSDTAALATSEGIGADEATSADSPSYYHASRDGLGDEATFDRGGYYEKVRDDGTPVQRVAAGSFCGWAQSETPELAASKTPAGAAFAQLYNVATDHPDGGITSAQLGQSIQMSIYRLNQEPDVDLSAAVAGDFGITEEVRYRRPGETPVEGTLVARPTFPGQVLCDVAAAYLPPSPHIITEWATTVRAAIADVLDGGEYDPEGPRPDPDAYRASESPPSRL